MRPAWAQANSAASQPGSPSSEDQSASGQGKILDDTRPLTGAEYLSLGTPERDRNVVTASIQADERADSNPSNATTDSSWKADTDLYGTAMLNRSWKRNSFVMQYAGGGSYIQESDLQSTQFLKASQVFGFQRAALTLSDQVTYSPEAPFGYPGPWAFSIGNVGTKPVLIPNQTVLTQEATRVSNVSVAELDYGLTRRSSLTALASYGLLDFFTTGVVNSNQVNGTVGYNYALTPHNKFALAYGYTGIDFLDASLNTTNTHSKTEVQTASASYGFQATGRLSFQLAAGSQLVKSFIPGSAELTNLYPYGQFVMTYAWHRTTLGLLGSQSILSGGGLYPASRATLAQASLSRLLSRRWEGAVLAGYARNSPLQTYLGTASQLSNTGYAGATVRRSLGRHAGLYLLYNFQRQEVNSFCTGVLCAQSYLRHSAGVGIDWRFTPWYLHVTEN
jgi:hypothetical protein